MPSERDLSALQVAETFLRSNGITVKRNWSEEEVLKQAANSAAKPGSRYEGQLKATVLQQAHLVIVAAVQLIKLWPVYSRCWSTLPVFSQTWLLLLLHPLVSFMAFNTPLDGSLLVCKVCTTPLQVCQDYAYAQSIAVGTATMLARRPLWLQEELQQMPLLTMVPVSSKHAQQYRQHHPAETRS